MTAAEFRTHVIPLYGSMRSVALRYLSEEDACDVVQDVMRKLWEIHAGLDIKTNLPAYVLRTIKNRCTDRLRCQVRMVSLTEADANFADNEDINELERRERLEHALDTLDQRKRKILELSLSGIRSEEIAEKLSISPPNVRQLLSRTRQELKRQLTKRN